MEHEQILNKLIKISELARRGEAGEKENANRKLTELMSKYGITWEDLDQSLKQETKLYPFPFKNKAEKQLLFQAFGFVTQQHEIRYRTRGRKIYFYLTPIQEIELRNFWDYYKKLWRKELETLFTAFIHKHNIFCAPSEDKEGNEISREEMESLMRILSSLRDSDYISTRRTIGG